MNFRKNIFRALVFMLLANVLTVAEENNGTITGKVLNAQTKSAVPFANILVMNTNFGSATDIDGNFRITNLPPNIYQVRISAIGYKSIVKTDVMVTNTSPTFLEISLMEEVIELEGVTVEAGYFKQSNVELSSVRYFNYEEIRRAPGGFEDVVRALSVLPGVAQADAGRNDLIVRGGAPSENLFLIDGIEVPNINHFGTQGATGGPLSFINLDYVSETSFSTGGFSSAYGDKLSSVLSIKLREGRDDRLGGKAVISASQFGLNVEGPLSSKSNFLFSARRSYLDFIFKAAGFSFVPEYYDFLTKFAYEFDAKNKLTFMLITALDNVKFFNDTDDKKFDNSRILGSDQTQYVTGLSFRHLYQDGFYTFTLSRNFVDYFTVQRDSLLNPLFLNESIEAENKLKFENIFKPNKTDELSMGATLSLIQFDANILFPRFATSFGEILPVNNLSTENYFYKSSLFFNYNSMWGNRVISNAGARLDYFDAIKNKFTVSPRVSLSYLLSAELSLNFSAGLYHQFPSYIWLAGDKQNKDLKAIRVDQYILGTDYQLRNDTQMKIEFYFKDYSNYPASELRPYLLLANTGAGFSGSEENFSQFGLEPLTGGGTGFARGVEFSLQKKLSDVPVYGIFSLTLNETKFTALDGVERFGSYDQRLILNLSGGYKFDENWEVSMKFRFATGRPITPFNADGTQSVANYLSERLPNPNSLDLRVDKFWFFDNFTLITYLDLQNIYASNNINAYRFNNRTKKIEENNSIGILPTIGVSLEF